MPQDSRKTIRQLSDHLLKTGIADYLVSEQFSHFCRGYDIDDVWDGLLVFAHDKPNLYGSDVAKNAFFLLLQHIYDSRKDQFQEILTGLLMEFSGKAPGPTFFCEIKQDLIRLGYSGKDVENIFSKTGK